MFDSLPDREDERATEDRYGGSSSAWRWAHLPAMLVFALLYLPLKSYVWSWYLAIGGAYTVLVFWIALGSSLKDSDDLFGNSEVLKYLPKMLLLHVLPLGLLLSGALLWFQLKQVLPEWATHEGHRGSLWDLLGWLALACTSVGEGFWMAGKVKQRFGPTED